MGRRWLWVDRAAHGRDSPPPLGAWDERGHDVLSLISQADRKYVTDFDDLPFAGLAKLHWVELDLGAWDAHKPLRLLIDGYTDYFTATSMRSEERRVGKECRFRWLTVI